MFASNMEEREKLIKSTYKSITSIYNHYRKEMFDMPYKNFSTKKEKTLVLKFIDFLDEKYTLETIGVDFLNLYFEYQFNYWRQSNTQLQNSSAFVSASWFVGQKAFNRWYKINSKVDWINNKNFTESGDYKKFKKREVKKIPFYINLSDTEELEKRRFNNDLQLKLYNCLEYTTLFNHKSNICLHCKKQFECINLLEEQFPNIYMDRINYAS